MCHLQGWILVGSMLILFLTGGSPARAQDQLALFRAALLANRANLEAFPTYKCRFTWTRATAANEKAALRREYKNVRSCDFVLVVDGGKQKFQALAPPMLPSMKQAVREKDGRLSVSVDFIPICDLNLGDRSLGYFRPFQEATVATDRRIYPAAPTPLGMCCLLQGPDKPPAKVFLEEERNQTILSGKGEMLLEQQVVVHTRGVFPSVDYEYYFDVSKGYLPLKAVRHVEPPWAGEKFDLILHVLQAKECSNQRWFPMTLLQIDVTPGKPLVDISELRVTELDVDRKPTDEDFAITIDAGTMIKLETRDTHKAPPFFYLKQQEKVTPEDIPRLARMLENVVSQPLMDTAVQSPGQSHQISKEFLGLPLSGTSVHAKNSLWKHS